MKKEIFKKELTESTVYATHYGVDFYDIKKEKDFYKVNKAKDFINKCYEGFKLAQDKIITNILIIEDELKIKNDLLNKIRKGKHRKETFKDSNYFELKKEIDELQIQKMAFQDVAGYIVWTIFLQEKTHIKSFFRTDGGSGYLKDRNIDSLIKVAKKLNEDPNKFTLINDITPSLHVGDLITVGDGTINITEVKQESVVNNLISKTVINTLEKKEVDKKTLEELYKKSPKHGFNQLKRFMNQLISFNYSKEYIKNDTGYDQNFKMNKRAINILTEDIKYNDLINIALDDLSKLEKKYIFLPPFDCCIVGIFKEEYSSKFVQMMDFKHHIYHLLYMPWEKCQYQKKDINFTDENPPEFFKYQEINIYDIKQKLFSTITPFSLILNERHVIDILTGEKNLYVYFDSNRFFEMCKENGLKPKWLSAKEMDTEKFKKEILPSFDGKYLMLGEKGNSMFFGYGLLFRIIFEFQFGESVIKQIKENFWINSNPKLAKVKDYLYKKKDIFKMFTFYCSTILINKVRFFFKKIK